MYTNARVYITGTQILTLQYSNTQKRAVTKEQVRKESKQPDNL